MQVLRTAPHPLASPAQILFAWVLTCIPYQMMIAIIGLLAALDLLLVGLPCCSPVQVGL